jgi:hypothetical protein
MSLFQVVSIASFAALPQFATLIKFGVVQLNTTNQSSWLITVSCRVVHCVASLFNCAHSRSRLVLAYFSDLERIMETIINAVKLNVNAYDRKMEEFESKLDPSNQRAAQFFKSELAQLNQRAAQLKYESAQLKYESAQLKYESAQLMLAQIESLSAQINSRLKKETDKANEK